MPFKDPEARRKWARDYARAHPELARKNYLLNKELIKARSREWHARNKDRARARAAKYRSANLQRIKENWTRWVAENRDRYRTIQVAGKARRRGALGRHTTAQWLEKVAALSGRCVYCGRSDLPLARDHVVPVVRGGTNYIENIVPACGSCNSKKHDRTLAEFMRVLELEAA